MYKILQLKRKMQKITFLSKHVHGPCTIDIGLFLKCSISQSVTLTFFSFSVESIKLMTILFGKMGQNGTIGQNAQLFMKLFALSGLGLI